MLSISNIEVLTYFKNEISLYSILVMYLILTVILGLIFAPRDWCKYVCVLGAYAQLYGRIRILGIRIDEETCKKCSRCLCKEKCPMDVNWA